MSWSNTEYVEKEINCISWEAFLSSHSVGNWVEQSHPILMHVFNFRITDECESAQFCAVTERWRSATDQTPEYVFGVYQVEDMTPVNCVFSTVGTKAECIQKCSEASRALLKEQQKKSESKTGAKSELKSELKTKAQIRAQKKQKGADS